MAIYMQDLIQPPVSSAFAINSGSLLLLCALFPVAGGLSDYFGRKRLMTIGGVAFGVLGPLMILRIGRSGGKNASWLPVFASQTLLSVSLACWGAPMCAWLVESFEPKARLTSVSIGYNVAQALAGGMSPFLATLLVDEVGTSAPGILLVTLSVISVTGLLFVVPPPPGLPPARPSAEDESIMTLELREIS
jgi:MHS family proline/betaine transporter-like MFS transporter